VLLLPELPADGVSGDASVGLMLERNAEPNAPSQGGW
jgi:hypothetical protein